MANHAGRIPKATGGGLPEFGGSGADKSDEPPKNEAKQNG